MKKMNKKGFTIVELVIVIAVIAILAAVMIPTFSSVVKDAQNAADLQKARNAYAAYAANISYKDGATAAAEVYVEVDTTEYYKVQNGKVDETATITTQADDIVINPEGTIIRPAG